MLTHVFTNAWFIIDIFVHNTVNSLNLDEDHNIDELSEGEPSFKIPDWWSVFQRVTSNGKGSGIYHSKKVCGSFKICDCMKTFIYGVTVLFVYILLLFEIEMVGKICQRLVLDKCGGFCWLSVFIKMWDFLL